jgi:hypothetical protein
LLQLAAWLADSRLGVSSISGALLLLALQAWRRRAG